MWAYPREFKDNSSASQIIKMRTNLLILIGALPFIGLRGVMQFLDDVSFPIVLG